MCSGVPALTFGHLFPNLEYWGPLEALAKIQHCTCIGVKKYQIFLHIVDGHEKTDFFMLPNTVPAPPLPVITIV